MSKDREKIIDGKEMADVLADFANNMSMDEKGFAEGVLRQHPTLQQSIMRLFVATIKNWADPNTYHDLRNQDTVELARDIVKKCEDNLHMRFI